MTTLEARDLLRLALDQGKITLAEIESAQVEALKTSLPELATYNLGQAEIRLAQRLFGG